MSKKAEVLDHQTARSVMMLSESSQRIKELQEQMATMSDHLMQQPLGHHDM